jgi:hypothetical protein
MPDEVPSTFSQPKHPSPVALTPISTTTKHHTAGTTQHARHGYHHRPIITSPSPSPFFRYHGNAETNDSWCRRRDPPTCCMAASFAATSSERASAAFSSSVSLAFDARFFPDPFFFPARQDPRRHTQFDDESGGASNVHDARSREREREGGEGRQKVSLRRADRFAPPLLPPHPRTPTRSRQIHVV